MEHQKIVPTKQMTKILKYLPRATSSVSFQSPQLYSPAKDKKPSEKPHKSNLGIGPIPSIIPPETRRKIKNDSKLTLLLEPTSPRVSCMGQVKCKHYKKLMGANNITSKPTNKFSRTTSYTPVRSYKTEEDQEKVVKVDPVVEKSTKRYGIRRLFGGGRRKCEETEEKSTVALTVEKGPCLRTMKKFSSGRDAFMSFDWTTQVAPLDCGGSDGEEVEMSSSALVRNKGVGDSFVRVGGVNLEARKEVNLWKRRTMVQPQPLQVHVAN